MYFLINIFSARNIIGEFAAIDCQPRSATAKAIERCALLEMEGECLKAFARQTPTKAQHAMFASRVFGELSPQCYG